MFEKLFEKIMLFISLIGICGCLFLADGMTASAAENDVFVTSNTGTHWFYFEDQPLSVGVYDVSRKYIFELNNTDMYYGLSANGRECRVSYFNIKTKECGFLKPLPYAVEIKKSDGSFAEINPNPNETSYPWYYFDKEYITIKSSLKVFSNIGDFQQYCLSGEPEYIYKDESLFEPDVDSTHDFSQDTYNPDMPVPQLSNISHHGFTLSNYQDGLYVDVIVENKLCGVKCVKGLNTTILGITLPNPSWSTVTDKSWTYSSHYWEMMHESEIAVGKFDVNIKNDFGVDIEGVLLDDFRNWSSEYPNVQKLPTFNPLWLTKDTSYQAYHVLKGDDTISQLKSLNTSTQAFTTYYVRYFDKNLNYGQWRYYKFDNNGEYHNGINIGGSVVGGDVNVDSDGNVSYDDTDKNYVDNNDGGSIYDPTDTMNEFDSSLFGFKETLRGFIDAVGAFPEFINQCLDFLPLWTKTFISLCIAVTVILRFLGR